MDPKRVIVCRRGMAVALSGGLGLELAGTVATTVVLAVRVGDALTTIGDCDLSWREGQVLLSASAGALLY